MQWKGEEKKKLLEIVLKACAQTNSNSKKNETENRKPENALWFTFLFLKQKFFFSFYFWIDGATLPVVFMQWIEKQRPSDFRHVLQVQKIYVENVCLNNIGRYDV